MSSLIKNIFIVGTLIIIAVAGYYLIVIKKDSSIETNNNAFVTGQAERETQEFLRRLEDIRTIKLSTDIFADPRFNSFQDFTDDVRPVPYGRDNPFTE